jgi:rhodanese-related sulfurtransferase
MPGFIDRYEVRRLVDEQDAVIAEVLPRAEYEWAHLAGAVHLPLKGRSTDELRSVLNPDRPAVVYCNDHQCDMSPRAAWRLETLGYDAHDYVAGKADWLAFGLPYEGSAVLAGTVLTTQVPTCNFRDRLTDVREALEASPYGMLVALNADGIVMGKLDRDATAASDEAQTVDRLMYEGPTTVRPSEELEPLAERMRHAGVDGVLVTRSDGTLIGLLERPVAERAIQEADHADR